MVIIIHKPVIAILMNTIKLITMHYEVF